MSLTFSPAKRSNIRPIVGFTGFSNSGKTLSALYLARGFVGPKGRVGLIDTERGRGKMFADVPSVGGYLYAELEEPFTPSRYVEAITVAEDSCDMLIVDSMSHSWNGAGGVLEWHEAELDRMAGGDWKKREKCSQAAWIKPKMDAARLVQKIARCKIPLICCFRGKEKTLIAKNQDGKTEIKKDTKITEIMDKNVPFEMLVAFEMRADEETHQGGFATVTKVGPPSLAPFLPKPGEQVSIHHGELLAQWCAAPSAEKPIAAPTIATLKKQLWDMTKPYHKGQTANLEAWLINSAILGETDRLANLSADQLQGVINQVQKITSDIPA